MIHGKNKTSQYLFHINEIGEKHSLTQTGNDVLDQTLQEIINNPNLKTLKDFTSFLQTKRDELLKAGECKHTMAAGTVDQTKEVLIDKYGSEETGEEPLLEDIKIPPARYTPPPSIDIGRYPENLEMKISSPKLNSRPLRFDRPEYDHLKPIPEQKEDLLRNGFFRDYSPDDLKRIYNDYIEERVKDALNEGGKYPPYEHQSIEQLLGLPPSETPPANEPQESTPKKDELSKHSIENNVNALGVV